MFTMSIQGTPNTYLEQHFGVKINAERDVFLTKYFIFIQKRLPFLENAALADIFLKSRFVQFVNVVIF